MSYLDELQRALTGVGIRGRLRNRILAEFADHLECDPDASLGDPQLVAQRFADELGTSRARRSAVVSFAALAAAAALTVAVFLVLRPGRLSIERSQLSILSGLGMALVTVGAQVAFVAGTLAALRAWRLRAGPVLPRREATMLARRAGVGVVGGLASTIGIGLIAAGYGNELTSSQEVFAIAAAAAGTVAMLAATPSVLAAIAVQPVAAGEAGDLFDDLGPLVPGPLRHRPWRFALVVAGCVAVFIALAGVVQDDGIDGALRGIVDGAACLAGFGILGRYLALRS